MEFIGLQEYIDKYGRHFTTELAIDVLKEYGIYKKKRSYIDKVFNKKVWYNVNGSTDGDILYMLNISNYKDVILYLENYELKESIFNAWLFGCELFGKKFDFRLYI